MRGCAHFEIDQDQILGAPTIDTSYMQLDKNV